MLKVETFANSLRMLERITENIREHPESVAFWIDGKPYSYRQLGIQMRRIAGYLHARAKVNQPIGVLVENDFDTYAALLGVLFSGNSFVPIHPGHPYERNRAIMDSLRLSEMICSNVAHHPEYRTLAHLTSINDLPLRDDVRLETDAGQIAYILFTSGSTGVPKGVPISVGNLEAFLDGFFALGMKLDSQDRFLQMFDLTFDLSVQSYLVPLILGASVHPLVPAQAKYLSIYKTLKDGKISYALMVPSVVNFLRPFLKKLQLPDLRYSVFCGEALAEASVALWRTTCPLAEQWNVYGPTEATIFCSGFKIDQTKSHQGTVSIGEPMKHVTMALFDENGRELFAPDEAGELCLSGAQVTSGYLSSEMTQRSFFDAPDGKRYYKTGDIAFKNQNGEYFFCGRKDTQAKIQGFRVEMGEIQHVASSVTKTQCIALFERAEDGNGEIFLFVENWKGTEEFLRESLKTHLPSYALPRKIVILERFPHNLNGKIDRKLLREYAAEG